MTLQYSDDFIITGPTVDVLQLPKKLHLRACQVVSNIETPEFKKMVVRSEYDALHSIELHVLVLGDLGVVTQVGFLED